MANVEFKDYTIKVKDAIDDRINAVLEECAGELESQVARNTRRKSGQTAGNWKHHVDDDKHIATIGNPLENAIWEEFGTGEYALNDNGRKGGWHYKDAEGKWHHTFGKKPNRALHNSFVTLKSALIRRAEQVLKGRMK